MLQSMRSQRVRNDGETEQQQGLKLRASQVGLVVRNLSANVGDT